MATWIAASVLAVARIATAPDLPAPWGRTYLRHLLRPWKLACAAIAATLLALAAPYSGDPTWDLGDSLVISAVVFLAAPWAVAIGARGLEERWRVSYLASAGVVFFLPCFTYDAYILIRDGVYPETWAVNLFLSGFVTLLAGLFWNLGWNEAEPSRFTFRWKAWPPTESGPFLRVLPMAILLALPFLVLSGAFVYAYWID